MKKCITPGCGSHAINHHAHGRDGSDGDLCDVCYWRKRAWPDWQPIETAPKTGKKVLLFYVNQSNNGRTVVARWLGKEEVEEIDEEGVGLMEGWYECIDNWDDYTDIAICEGYPTLWMPLPLPPSDFTLIGKKNA